MRPPTIAIQDPTVRDHLVESGTFVVLAVDPTASVRQLDEQAKLEAAAMVPVKYLALLIGYADFEFGPHGQLLTPKFLLVGHGLPPPPTSWSAIPLSPAPPHPETGRPPLRISPPLQWGDCHIYTSSMLNGLVSCLHPHRSLAPQLSLEDYKRVKRDLRADNTRTARELRAKRTLAEKQNPQEAAPKARTPYVHNDDVHGGPLVIEDLVDNGETPRMKLCLQLWLDTDSVSDFGDPDGVYEEVKRLQQIEWDWAHRTVAAMLLANKPNTEAWVNAVADADAPTPDPDSSELVEADVDDLRPEDAVDSGFNKGYQMTWSAKPMSQLRPRRQHLGR
ncbi:hypothetical protein AURDEDRAFT_168252 [Auricularia subglabra TFB-10046 SS5]|nr:hypothetical protein AURDEDRAFT_168252 [Auricularia subglabra TFB-10046 SS5]